GSAHGLNDASGERHEIYETTPVAWLTKQLGPAEGTQDVRRRPALDSIAAAGVETGIPGIAVALVGPDGSISTGAAGVADRRTDRPFAPGAHIHAGSTTKAVTAAAVLLLVDRGELALTDTLTNLVRSRVVEPIPHANRMTVLQLLEHRTGLYSPNNDPRYLGRYIGPERTELPFWTPEEIAGFAADPSNDPLFEPGQEQAYGDINYVLLALIVRDVAGEPFKAFVRREIFRPLQMRGSWYLSDRPDAPRARGYTMESEIIRSIGLDPALEADEDGYIDTTDAQERSDGAAGIISTVVDLGRFAHAVTHTDFLAPESRALFRGAAERIGTEDDDEALGILRGYAFDGRRLLTSEGDGPGTNVIWALDPETGRIAVAAANLFGRWDEADLLLNDLIPAVLAVD
ncbi:MAG: serine hydrolase domain-containing protein, partial [Gemmatimonadota bacterium]